MLYTLIIDSNTRENLLNAKKIATGPESLAEKYDFKPRTCHRRNYDFLLKIGFSHVSNDSATGFLGKSLNRLKNVK
jgi:hypothetical protein